MRPFPPGLLPGPFTIAQARALGVSEQMLRGKRLRAVLPGVYVAADTPDDLVLRCRAARLLIPAAVFSHETAVLLRRLPMPLDAPRLSLHLSVARDERGVASTPRLTGATGHRTTWAPGDVVRFAGLPVTSTERTFCDLAAAGWDRLDLVAYADALIRHDRPRDLHRLATRVSAWENRRGARRLSEALSLARFRVDSPMETRLRLLLHDAGLPLPDVNLWIYDENGDMVHRPDLSWRQWRYAVDYDGEHHFEKDADEDVVAKRRINWRARVDQSRITDLRGLDWTLRVVTAYELLHEPDRLVAAVRKELRAAGAPL